MHSIAGLQHRTPAWKGGVIADEWQALAEIARRVGNETRLQIGDHLVALDEVGDLLVAERNRMTPEDAQRMTVSIKADRDTPMGVIADVKRELQQVYALKVNYAATEK